MTRFQVTIMPKDGSRHRHLSVDSDQVLCPHLDDAVMLTDGITTHVLTVSYAPTMDPCVWVRGRTLFPRDQTEADEIVNMAKAEGWREIG